MRDFPIFTTEYGVSSLTLREIPYKKEAYICIRDVQTAFFQEHLSECVGFCKMAGAERVFATGHEMLQAYPNVITIVQMRGQIPSDVSRTAQLFPVTESTVGKWREIYNGRMRAVPNARTLEKRDEATLLQESGVYFVHREGTLLGIGWLRGEKLEALASVIPGEGECVMRTLLSLLDGESVTLEVAASNRRAVHLYEKLGLLKTAEVARWHDVT